MDIEVLIGIMGVFTSGIGIGVGTTIFTQWAHRKLRWQPPDPSQLRSGQLDDLQGEADDLTKAFLDLNQRMEFQERLLAEKTPKDETAGIRPSF